MRSHAPRGETTHQPYGSARLILPYDEQEQVKADRLGAILLHDKFAPLQ
jgi:hypothetical protein